jgi:hypothetical protein
MGGEYINFCNVRFDIAFSSTPWSLHFSFSAKTLFPFPIPSCVLHDHLVLVDFITLIIIAFTLKTDWRGRGVGNALLAAAYRLTFS